MSRDPKTEEEALVDAARYRHRRTAVAAAEAVAVRACHTIVKNRDYVFTEYGHR
jgi:hypothetical protein